VDKRADIWAFGAVLYEMLAGRKAFEGETVSDTLAAVLRAAIDWDALPRETPASVRRVLRRCLDREPNRRLRDIGEARIEIDAIASGTPEAVADEATDPRRRAVARAAVVAALAIAAAAAVAVSWLAWRSTARPAAGPAPVTEFSIWAGDLRNLALSPDGRRLAYVDTPKLFLRDLADRLPHEILDDREVRAAVWSPAGDELAVEIGERLWRVPIGGGERRPICELPKLAGVPRSIAIAGTWLRNDTLLFAAWRGGIYKVAATGGKPELSIPIDPKVEVDFHFVQALPDGESLLLAAHRLGGSSNPGGTMSIELYRKGLRTAIALEKQFGNMLPVGYSQGLLLTIQGETATDRPVWAFPFNAELGKIVGKPTILVPRAVDAVVGTDGTLAYVAQRDSPGAIMRLDRKGGELGPLGKPRPRLAKPVLSPDGSRLALVIDSVELWVHDLGRDTMTRLVRDPQSIEDPQWSPDGQLLYYTVGNASRFRRVRADPGAEPETVFDDANRSFLAPDGRGALIRVGGYKQTESSGFYWVPFDERGRPGKRRKLLGGFDSYGRLSPDGRALAYGSLETGRREAYVSAFPGMDQTIQLSSDGGGTPQWSTDGRSVFYVAGGGLVAVDVGLDPAGRLKASPARKLFEFGPAHLLSDRGWSLIPDGSGFLFVKSLETESRSEIVVRRNALSGAERKSP
jgi:dipeptidyl aminopeptidase/acylaminoacyl peptidase